MLSQETLKTDADRRRISRIRQNDVLEVLVAASEAETLCADWFFEQRSDAGRFVQ